MLFGRAAFVAMFSALFAVVCSLFNSGCEGKKNNNNEPAPVTTTVKMKTTAVLKEEEVERECPASPNPDGKHDMYNSGSSY